jgi:hypothetical protein
VFDFGKFRHVYRPLTAQINTSFCFCSVSLWFNDA